MLPQQLQHEVRYRMQNGTNVVKNQTTRKEENEIPFNPNNPANYNNHYNISFNYNRSEDCPKCKHSSTTSSSQ